MHTCVKIPWDAAVIYNNVCFFYGRCACMNMFKILLKFLHSSVKCMHDTCMYDTSSHHSSQGICKGACL